MSHPIRGQGGYLVFLISPKNASLVEDVRILLPSSVVEFYSAVLEEKLKMSQQIIDRGGHFVFPILLKNTDLV